MDDAQSTPALRDVFKRVRVPPNQAAVLADALWLTLHGLPVVPERTRRAAQRTVGIPKQHTSPKSGSGLGPSASTSGETPGSKTPETDGVEGYAPPIRIEPLQLQPISIENPIWHESRHSNDDRAAAERIPIGRPPSFLNIRRLSRTLGVIGRVEGNPDRHDLDVVRTAERFASRERTLVYRDEFRPHLNLTILIDGSAAMRPWDAMIQDVQAIFRHSRAFAEVSTYTWHIERSAHGAPVHDFRQCDSLRGIERIIREPGHVVQRTGAQIVLIVSNFVAKRWRTPAVRRLLWDWTKSAHVSIMPLLSQRFRPRTALGGAQLADFTRSSAEVGAALDGTVRNVFCREPDPDNWVKLTLVAPHQTGFLQWAGFMARRKRTCTGFYLPLDPGPLTLTRPEVGSAAASDSLRPLFEFWRGASEAARKMTLLTSVAALFTIRLPYLRMLRGAFLPDASAETEAELILSGLLQPEAGSDGADVAADAVTYEFVNGAVQKRLKEELERDPCLGKTDTILEVLQTQISQYSKETARDTKQKTPSGFARSAADGDGKKRLGVRKPSSSALRVLEMLTEPQRRRWSWVVSSRDTKALNGLLLQADRCRADGDVDGALAKIDAAHEVAVSTDFGDGTGFVLEALDLYRAALRLPELIARSGPAQFVEPTTGMILARIPAGRFLMGSPQGEAGREDREGPRHEVTITHDFWIGLYPVTQAQYEQIAKTNPSKFKGAERPVERVSWEEAREYCAALTDTARKAELLPTGYEIRLPTEAEWEYCCRAGTQTATAFGDDLSSAKANFDGNHPYGKAEKGVYLEETSDVGKYAPNAWGLYDMHGNVWEWCLDGQREYTAEAQTDPVGPMEEGRYPVSRGGSWNDLGRYCRSAFRYAIVPGFRYISLGFRVCLARSPGRSKS